MTEIERLSAKLEMRDAEVELYKDVAGKSNETAARLLDTCKALREDYAAMLRLHNTTAQAARAEECAMRLKRRKVVVEDGA